MTGTTTALHACHIEASPFSTRPLSSSFNLLILKQSVFSKQLQHLQAIQVPTISTVTKMGATRPRTIAGTTSTTTTHVDKSYPSSSGRIGKAYKFAHRVMSATAGMARLPKRLQVLGNLGSKTPFQVITKSLFSLRPSIQIPERATISVVEDTVREACQASPQDPIIVPKLILTTPDGDITTPNFSTTWRKIERTLESDKQFTEWIMGEFLSPLYYAEINTARDRRRVKNRIARVRAAKARQLQAWKKKKNSKEAKERRSS